MNQSDELTEEYDDVMVATLELLWGEGFMAPGGADLVRRIVRGLDLKDKLVLDIGCGIGGGDLVLAGELGARVIGVDLVAANLARARAYAERAGLSDRIEFRLVEAGPIAFDDESFDAVYTCGAFIHMPDKAAMFAEVKRVLRPGGVLAGYDWLRGPEPSSDDMKYWLELEGLGFEMETLEAYLQHLRDVGFTDVEGESDGGWYAQESRAELARLKTPLREAMLDAIGQDKYEHFLEDWRMLSIVTEKRELRPGTFRGIKSG